MQRTTYRPRNSNRREQVVEDLREKLNRIKLEKTLTAEVGTKNLPPPDPVYNYLKDPLRGDNLDSEKKSGSKDYNIKHKAKCESKTNDKQKNYSSKTNEKSNTHENRNTFDKSGTIKEPQNWRQNTPPDNWQPRKWKDRTLSQYSTKEQLVDNTYDESQPQKGDKTLPQHSIKQQSVNNIKVIVSNESGERKCTMDETVLVQLPLKTRRNYTPPTKLEKLSQKHYADENKQREKTKEQLQTNLVIEEALTITETQQEAETIQETSKDGQKIKEQVQENDNKSSTD